MKRIEEHLLKENYYVGLGFPKGYIFFRILGVERFVFKWDYVTEVGSALSADELKEDVRLSYDAQDIKDILLNQKKDELYQVFIGVDPSYLKIYLKVPTRTPQRELIEYVRWDKAPFGEYVDGFESPLEDPSPDTELWIPKSESEGFYRFDFYNPMTFEISPFLKIYISRYKVKIVRDPDLIEGFISGRIPCRLVTMAGLRYYDYRYRDYYDIDPIPIDATRDEIERAVAPKKGGA